MLLVVSALSIVGLHAQRITFRDGQVSVEQAIDAIMEQTQHTVTYNKNLLGPARRISVTTSGMEMRALLDVMVAGIDADYIVEDRRVVFVPAVKRTEIPVKPEPELPVELPVVAEVIVEPTVQPMPIVQPVTRPVTTIQPMPQAPEQFRLGVKTNLLYDATATLNLGLEFRTGGRTSVDLPLNFNMWEFGRIEKRSWRHVLVQPGFRVWTREAFDGHFFGVHGHWGAYFIAGLPINDYMRERHFEGSLVGGGVSWGYRWKMGSRWAMETELGVGYARLKYKEYAWCGDCAEYTAQKSKDYLGPTKLAVNLVYSFGGERSEYYPQYAPQPTVAPQVVLKPAPDATTHPFTPSFAVPAPEPIKEREDVITADVRFVFDNSTLDEGFMDNASQLRRLREGIEDLKRDPKAEITAIDVSGFASPEGTEAYNFPLSARRAEAVRDYLRVKTGLPVKLFSTRGMGERPDYLRMATVEVSYTVEPFSLDNIRRTLHTRPQMLSVDEMFRLAWTYKPDSKEYREILEIAAATFPNDDVANINAAAANLLHGDADRASFYLERTHDHSPAWWDNLGIVFYLRGDLDRAAMSFSNAETTGESNAEILESLQ